MSDPIHGLFMILRKRQLCARIGLSSAQVYAMLDPKSPSFDSTFPKQVRLAASAVGWLEHEIQAWLETRVKLSREGKGRDDTNAMSARLQKKESIGDPGKGGRGVVQERT